MAEKNSSAHPKTAVPADDEAFEHFVSDCDGAGIQYDGPSYEQGFLSGKVVGMDAAQAVEAQAAPAAASIPTRQFTDGTRTLRQDCISSIRDFASSTPEEGEEWDVWFAAAFDLLGNRINAIFDEHATSAGVQADPVAWQTFDGEGGYDYRSYEHNESYMQDWDRCNPKHKGWVKPLYAAPQAQPADALDAARYRHLRDGVMVDGEINEALYVRVDQASYPNRWALVGQELDGAIDAAMAAAQEGGNAAKEA